MNSAVIIAAILFVLILLSFAKNRKKQEQQVEQKKTDYKVPLSDDVQKIYFEKYEKQMQEEQNALKQEPKEDRSSEEHDSLQDL
ncbi:hypothetical protein FYJ51_09310 [Erysipelotrichaceae bacterium Oil+RF-744-GAM-WT-6]|uniref:Uncharacterized protein n=1 Tax=Stecheria intestinalis TaxID=2606630 RepID=A0A7X2NT57_9FIRM|nr:hypothetical protein [Stecheria intestinalis]MSS59097.1 hypothetical protein [Stecheria intestinalis]